MLSESTLRASPMAWQRWRSNSVLTANSTRHRWKNSSFSIIPAAAPVSAWRWIGKRRICQQGNKGDHTQRIPRSEIHAMKLSYYPDTDSLYIDLAAEPSAESRDVSEGVVL